MNLLNPMLVAWLQAAERPVAVVDIDGVTLDNNHRLPHIVHVVDGVQVQRDDADWTAFHDLGHLDTAGAALPLIKRLPAIYSIVFVTARVAFGNQMGILTEQLRQMLNNQVAFGLVMREPKKTVEGDPIQGHAEYKRSVIREMRSYGLDPQVGIDDSLVICQMFAEEGLLSLRCHNHVPEAALWR